MSIRRFPPELYSSSPIPPPYLCQFYVFLTPLLLPPSYSLLPPYPLPPPALLHPSLPLPIPSVPITSPCPTSSLPYFSPLLPSRPHPYPCPSPPNTIYMVMNFWSLCSMRANWSVLRIDYEQISRYWIILIQKSIMSFSCAVPILYKENRKCKVINHEKVYIRFTLTKWGRYIYS